MAESFAKIINILIPLPKKTKIAIKKIYDEGKEVYFAVWRRSVVMLEKPARPEI